MNGRASDARAVLVVSLKSEQEQESQIMEVLRELEIPADVVKREAASRPPVQVALRIPSDCVAAAALALERHGFRHVRAYAGDFAVD